MAIFRLIHWQEKHSHAGRMCWPWARARWEDIFLQLLRRCLKTKIEGASILIGGLGGTRNSRRQIPQLALTSTTIQAAQSTNSINPVRTSLLTEHFLICLSVEVLKARIFAVQPRNIAGLMGSILHCQVTHDIAHSISQSHRLHQVRLLQTLPRPEKSRLTMPRIHNEPPFLL